MQHKFNDNEFLSLNRFTEAILRLRLLISVIFYCPSQILKTET